MRLGVGASVVITLQASAALTACDARFEPAPEALRAAPAEVPALVKTSRQPSATRVRGIALHAPRSAPQTKPRAPSPCPDDMQPVVGAACRDVEQRCLEYVVHQGVEDKDRCRRFAASECRATAPRRPMSFCMDRYEYPNRAGELPMTLVEWGTATALCEKRGKRLCTEAEFTFACEGEEMRPYATGFEREPAKCNIDLPFLKRRATMLPEAECAASSTCSSEWARLDRRRKIGESPECVSPFGIYDLNGNVNEWVAVPWGRAPHRAALKGGWWGPVRNRCRAIAASHDENYVGHEVGFRCCQDLPAASGT